MSERIGFIGLGIMGRGMANNLLNAGFSVTVWNRTESRMAPFVEAGAQAGANPADVASKSDIIIVCVSDTPDVEGVVLGDDGVIYGAQPGSLVIDHSTISPSVTKEIAAKLSDHGIRMLDAPISGGSEGAANGTLSIMVGGEEEQFERALPVLQAMGKTITHVGPNGAGQATKLVNQVLVVGNALAMSEALMFAQASDLDLEKVFDAVSQGAGGSWFFTNRAPQIMARDFAPGFTIALQQKDVRLVLQAADEIGAPLFGTGIVFNLYRTLEAMGLEEEGNHALIKALENLAGYEVKA